MDKKLFVQKLEYARASLKRTQKTGNDSLTITDLMKPWTIRYEVNQFIQMKFIRSVVAGIGAFLDDNNLKSLNKPLISEVKAVFDVVIDVLPNIEYQDEQVLNKFIDDFCKQERSDYQVFLDKYNNLWILSEDPALKLHFKDWGYRQY